MRIEIIGGSSSGTLTISGLHTDFDSLLTETDSVIDALNKLKSFSYNMSGGIGILQDAVGNVDGRLQAEENKKDEISSAKGKCESFLQLVSTIDSQVAETVSQNQDEFYRLNRWSKPSIIESTMEKWYKSARAWIMETVKNGVDYLAHSWNVYNEVDFDSLTSSELQKYAEVLLKRIADGVSGNDDRIRLKSLYKYVSKRSIHNKLLYITLFEQVYPEKMQAINKIIDESAIEYSDDQKLAMMYYMANGTSKNTALTLWRELRSSNNIIGDQYELMQFEYGEGFYQGNFWIGNFDVSELSDGSCIIRAVAHQSPVSKSEGAIIIYNEFGIIEDVQVLNRYQNPTDFVSAVQTIWKDWHGEDYEETPINIKIPKGGYAQITDDPNVLEYIQGDILDKKLQEEMLDPNAWEDAADLTSGDVKVVGTVEPSYVEYGETVSTYVDIAKRVNELVDDLETGFWSNQQKGSGSCYIYNH